MSTPPVATRLLRVPRSRPAGSPQTAATGAGGTVPPRVLVVLALLSAIGPLSIDMYLPTFPVLADDLSTSATRVQLTLTTFMVGMALGQLVLGPLSDRLGRRRLLVAGALTCCLAAVVCALTPSIGVMIVARAVQGFSGAAGLVIGRAVVSDLAHGRAAARAFSALAMIQGIAPVAAPLMGGALAVTTGWRGTFTVIAVAALLMAVAVTAFLPETLPAARRHSGGVRDVAVAARAVLSTRSYVGYASTCVLAFAGLFAYVSASPFVLQNVVGLSTGWFSIVFGVNALGIGVGGALSAFLLRRVEASTVLVGAVLVQLGGAVLLLVAVLFLGTPTPLVLVLLWIEVATCGLVFGNATALAAEHVRFAAGTGSALQGAVQFTLGALVSPLVGLAGEHSAVPMAVVLLSSSTLAALTLFTVARPFRRAGRSA